LNMGEVEELIIFEPTKANIMKYFQEMFEFVHQNETKEQVDEEFIWFHFSGHGTQVEDTGGDEDDGFDEAICPCNCEDSDGKGGYVGMITDDFFNSVITKYPDVDLFCTFDCCHSGTMLDLPTNEEIANGAEEFPGRAISFSSCGDAQTAADIFIEGDEEGEENKNFGGFSTAFTKVITECVLRNIDVLLVDLADIETLITNNYVKLNIHKTQAVNCAISDADLTCLGSILFKQQYQHDSHIDYHPPPIDADLYAQTKVGVKTRDIGSDRAGALLGGIQKDNFVKEAKLQMGMFYPGQIISVQSVKSLLRKNCESVDKYNEICILLAKNGVRNNSKFDAMECKELLVELFKKENDYFVKSVTWGSCWNKKF